MKKKFLCFLLFSAVSTAARADLFSITLTQGANTTTQTFTSVKDIFDRYQDGELDQILAGYNKNQAATANINFRGIPMTLSYDGSNDLTVKIPAIDFDMSFGDGSMTQAETFDAFKDYMEKNANNMLRDLLRASVKTTPYDIVAGNPNSLMARMVDAPFYIAQRGGVFSPDFTQHTLQMAGQPDVTVQSYNLPLGYTFSLVKNRMELIWDMPVTYADVDGSKGYAAQMGLALRPVFKRTPQMEWTLALGGRTGVAYSEDMMSGGLLYSYYGVNHIKRRLTPRFAFALTNMVGYLSNYSVTINDYEINYDINSWTFKNGADLEMYLSPSVTLTATYNHTQYSNGDDYFISKYNETGGALTWRNTDPNGTFAHVSLFGSYLFGDNYSAVRGGISLGF